jgi:hypothetical protein
MSVESAMETDRRPGPAGLHPMDHDQTTPKKDMALIQLENRVFIERKYRLSLIAYDKEMTKL